jgi:hypothetical protein
LLFVPLISSAQFQRFAKKATDKATAISSSNSIDIAAGLKEAFVKYRTFLNSTRLIL